MKLEKIDHICFAVKDLEGFFKYQVSSIQYPVSSGRDVLICILKNLEINSQIDNLKT